MATQSLLYSSVTAFTLTGTSLAAFGTREGTIVANSANLYVDMVLSGKITTGGTAPTGNCYILASSSDGTNVSTPATGTDSAITTTMPGIALAALENLQYGQIVPGTQLVFLQKIQTAGLPLSTAVPFNNIYVAQAFGGNLPIGGWAPVIVNMQGPSITFSATAANYVFNYTGLKYTIA